MRDRDRPARCGVVWPNTEPMRTTLQAAFYEPRSELRKLLLGN